MAGLGLALMAGGAMAGNPDRVGSAGATQLLVNPWARSNGWSLANTSTLSGAEGMFGNVAGLAHVRKTEILFTSTRWLEGSGVDPIRYSTDERTTEDVVAEHSAFEDLLERQRIRVEELT